MNLKGVRAFRNLKQSEVAEKMGITPKTYCKKEKGVVEFTQREIAKLASILELSIDDVNEIFFGNELTKRKVS